MLLKSFQITNNGGQTLKIAPHRPKTALSRLKFPPAQPPCPTAAWFLPPAPLKPAHTAPHTELTVYSRSDALLLLLGVTLSASKPGQNHHTEAPPGLGQG